VDILRFCHQICKGVQPVWVDIHPDNTAEPSSCFVTVAKAVKAYGGKCVCGWDITEFPTVYLEAEFHGVWCNTDGELIDLTPHELPYKRILFLPDATRQYEGYRLDNFRIASTPDPLVARYIEIAELLYADMLKNGQVHQLGTLKMSRNYAILKTEMLALENQLMNKYGARYFAGLKALGIEL